MRSALWLYAGLLYAFIFLPVGVMALFSFQGGRLPIPPFDGPSLRWYAAVYADRQLMAALGNSLIVAIISSAFACGLGFFAARGLARNRLPASGLQRALLTAPLAVSTLLIGLGLLALFNALGLPRSLWTVGIGHVVINLPLAFLILSAAMGAQQQAMERAARDLGAGEWDLIRLVTLPAVAPALLAAFCLSLTFSWDEFIIAFLLARFEVTLPVEIWSLLRAGLNPKTNAIGSLVFLVSIALVLVLELAVFSKAARR